MTTHRDPGHGFVITHDDGAETIASDHGDVIRLTVKGRSGSHAYTPTEARSLADALVTWADRKDLE